jgi:hypothetical protein
MVLRDALAAALPPVDSTMQIGLVLFPSTTVTSQSCTVSTSVQLVPGFGHVGQMNSLLSKVNPGGATPTAEAVQVAANALLNVRAATTARSLVLATDGGPNCNLILDPRTCPCIGRRCTTAQMCLDDIRTVSRIKTIADQGIPTYVIGLQEPGETETNAVLDRMAEAGGRPQMNAKHRYYAATSAAELDAALIAIRDQVGACTFLTASVPDADGTITITADGVVLPYDETGKIGWRWGNRENGEIIFAQGTCMTSVGKSLKAVVECDPKDANIDARSTDSSNDSPSSDASGD